MSPIVSGRPPLRMNARSLLRRVGALFPLNGLPMSDMLMPVSLRLQSSIRSSLIGVPKRSFARVSFCKNGEIEIRVSRQDRRGSKGEVLVEYWWSVLTIRPSPIFLSNGKVQVFSDPPDGWEQDIQARSVGLWHRQAACESIQTSRPDHWRT